MNKCEVCKVYVSCFNQEKCCAFEHNGDKDICPFEDEYLDLSVHDEKVRADERAKVFKIIEERLNDDTTITFDLPVEEILGDDIDMDDFLMLAEEIVQQYKSLIFSKLREANEQSNKK